MKFQLFVGENKDVLVFPPKFTEYYKAWLEITCLGGGHHASRFSLDVLPQSPIGCTDFVKSSSSL